MMQFLRDSMRPIFLITIVAFIVGFVFLDIGMGGSTGCSQRVPNALVVVNGEPISPQEVDARTADALSSFPRQNMNERLSLQIRNQTFNQLIEDRLLTQVAEERGLGTDLDEVLQIIKSQPPAEIRNAPIFQTDGQFDINKYYQALANGEFMNRMVAMLYERQPIENLRNEISESARASYHEVSESLNHRGQKATISYIRFSPRLFGPDPANLSASEVEAYYDANAAEYTPEETADLTYAFLGRRPSETDVLETSEVMQSIYFELEAGESFDDLLNIHSDASFNMRGGPQGAFVNPTDPGVSLEMASTIDSLEIGQYSLPFRDDFGYHIVLLDSTRTETDGRTTYRLKDIMIRVRPSSTTNGELASQMYEFWEAVNGDKSFQDAAEETEIRVATTDPINLDRPRPFVPGVPVFEELATFLREATPGEVSPMYEGPGGWYVWQLDRRGPGSRPDLVNVEIQVRSDLASSNGSDQARRLADEVIRMAKSGTPLEEIADADSLLHVDTSRPFPRAAASIIGLGYVPEVIGTSFAMEVGSVAGPFTTDDGTLYVIRLDERDPVNPPVEVGTDEVGVLSLQKSLVDQKLEDILSSYLQQLREEAKIQDFRQVRIGSL